MAPGRRERADAVRGAGADPLDGANILHLSYFSNFVLLGSFLGIGLGFLRARRARDVSAWWPVVLAPLVAFVLVFPVQVTQDSDQILYFRAVRPTAGPRG